MLDAWQAESNSPKIEYTRSAIETMAGGDPLIAFDRIVEAGQADPEAQPSPELMDQLYLSAYGEA